MNSTVTGIVADADGTKRYIWVTFTPLDAPFVQTAGEIVTPQPVKKRTSKTGAFSVTLAPGTYEITAPTTPETFLTVTVPSLAGTYPLDQLLNGVNRVSGDATVPAPPQVDGDPTNTVWGYGWTWDRIGYQFYYNPTGDAADWFPALKPLIVP